MPVDCLRAKELVLRIEKCGQWECEGREVRRAQREPWYGALRRVAEIVILVAAIIDAVSRSNHRLAVQD